MIKWRNRSMQTIGDQRRRFARGAAVSWDAFRFWPADALVDAAALSADCSVEVAGDSRRPARVCLKRAGQGIWFFFSLSLSLFLDEDNGMDRIHPGAKTVCAVKLFPDSFSSSLFQYVNPWLLTKSDSFVNFHEASSNKIRSIASGRQTVVATRPKTVNRHCWRILECWIAATASDSYWKDEL